MQFSTVLWVLGLMFLLFGLFLVPLILADLRSGHQFWLLLVAVDEVVAIALIATAAVFNLFGRQSLRPSRH